MPRIVGGTAKGQRIKTPPGDVRPATARVRQSLFDYLSQLLQRARVIDLYCGSGGLGLEAISRGAAEALFVDLSYRSIEVARENSRNLHFIEKTLFIKKDVFRFLNTCRTEPVGRFDIVFAAPPYRIAEPERILSALDGSDIIEPDGVVCLEYSRHTSPPQPDTDRFSLDRRRLYGETVIEVWDYRIG